MNIFDYIIGLALGFGLGISFAMGFMNRPPRVPDELDYDNLVELYIRHLGMSEKAK